MLLTPPILLRGRRLTRADFRNNFLPGNVSFARASRATVWTPAGLAEVEVNQPRFNHDPATSQPLGLLFEPLRTSRVSNSRGEGAVAGTPGTLPTGWTVSAGALHAQTTPHVEQGVPGVAVRFTGNAPSTGALTLAMSGIAADVVATYRASIYLRLLAGSLSNVTSDAGFVLRIGTSGATSGLATPLAASLSGGMFRALLAKANVAIGEGINIRWNYVTAGQPVDFTMFVGGPQFAASAEHTSLILNPPGVTTGSVTRDADSAVATVPARRYDILRCDTVGGEWLSDVDCTSGTYVLAPRALQNHLRLVEFHPVGTAAAQPGLAGPR